jgi:hypothetical protein
MMRSGTFLKPAAVILMLFTASGTFAQTPGDWLTNPNFLIEYGAMTTDLDARHHRIINLDTSNLGLTGTHAVTFFVDGAGSALTAGTKNPVKIPYGGTLQGWVMICKPSGSVTADVLRAADGAGLPVTSIVGPGTKPAVATNVENSSTTFTSWTSTTLTAKDNLAINLSGITAATYCELTLYFQ